jgi:hypothetical protein
MNTFTGAKPVESGTGVSAATGRGALVPAGLVGAGISLIVVVGLIHLINSPEDLQEGSYTGLLYLANFLGALAGYVISRTVGLPGLPVEAEWLEPLGVLSLVVEGLFVGVYLAILARPEEETRIVEAGSSTPTLMFSKEEGHGQEDIDAVCS